MTSGGGFYLKISEFFFNNHLLVYILFPISFYFCNEFLELKKTKNLILFLLLIFVEIDGFFFMESYDPLFYLLFSLSKSTSLYNVSSRSINKQYSLFCIIFVISKKKQVFFYFKNF